MLSDLAVEILVRIVATAAIVIGVTLAVERLGSKTGGALAGLPIVIGPAFFFLLRENSVAFNANAAAASLMSLTATQGFLMGYVAFAARSRWAIVPATLAWIVCAGLFAAGPSSSPWVGLFLFVSAAVLCRKHAKRYLRPYRHGRAQGTLYPLVLRGIVAGLLVAGITLLSDKLGPAWSGFLIAYPVGLTVISITIHQRSGADAAIWTLHAIMLGISSLAAFGFGLSVLIVPLGPVFAFVLALWASVLVTFSLIYAAPKAPS